MKNSRRPFKVETAGYGCLQQLPERIYDDEFIMNQDSHVNLNLEQPMQPTKP
jgi:hypothetical protein